MSEAHYELLDKDGKCHGKGFKGDLVDLANTLWPNSHQDDSGPKEEPNGWYLALIPPIEVVS